MTTRPSAVAGLFYADDPDELRMQVLGLPADVAASTKVVPKSLIAPHAGYAYSGRVAAAAFATSPSESDDTASAIESVQSGSPKGVLRYLRETRGEDDTGRNEHGRTECRLTLISSKN
jgi:Memo-like protein